jgi:hypothetical protein
MSYRDWTLPFSNFWITLWKIIIHRAMESYWFSPWSCDDDGSRVFQSLPSRIHRRLSLRCSKYSKWYVRFDRLNELFAMVCSVSSLEILLCGEILNILQNKWEQHNSWSTLESSPTTMLYGLFHTISCNSWWLIMSISDHQQVSPSLTFASPSAKPISTMDQELL